MYNYSSFEMLVVQLWWVIYSKDEVCVSALLKILLLGGESGSADTVRDPRGFAVKFYTEDGNWDLVGNNTPIFFIRDPILVGVRSCHNFLM